jgi:hypothetical protein
MEQKRFYTTDSELKKYNNTTVEVIGPLDETKYDRFDVGNMYEIRFYDGKEAQAFEDELIEEE